jgi:hypothetical protein
MDGPIRAMPGESPLDRIIRQSASEGRPSGEQRRAPRFTLIGTSHILQRLGYAVRTAFDHLVHLREDPKALRRAVVRSLRLRGIAVTNDAAPVFERMLGTVYDCAETLVQTCIERVELECDLAPDPAMRPRPTACVDPVGSEWDGRRSHDDAVEEHGTPRSPIDRMKAKSKQSDLESGDAENRTNDDVGRGKEAPAPRSSIASSEAAVDQNCSVTPSRDLRFTIDRTLAASIIEEDLPCRLGDEHFAGALRRHLAGRVVDAANEGEIAEIAGKLGWSAATVRTAVETMVREDAAKRIL